MNFKESYANTKSHVKEIVWFYRCVWYEKQEQVQDTYYIFSRKVVLHNLFFLIESMDLNSEVTP